MTTEQLEAIRERAEKATEGPWKWQNDAMLIQSNNGGHVISAEVGVKDGAFIDATPQDEEFIAHAREDIPALLAEVERMTGVIGSLRSNLELIEERTEGQANNLARGAIKYANEEIR